MRIAITNPTTWPQLRRGVERFMNELATWLSSRGHDVTIITAHPGPTEVRNENNHRTILHRRLWTPALGRAGFLEVHAFALTTFAALMRDSYDIVHCCTFMDAFAARAARRITGTPYIFWVNALPPKILYYKSMSTGGAVFRRAVLGADELIVLSEYMQNTFAERFNRPGLRIPPPVDTTQFQLNRTRDLANPTILCTAALDDQRKGGRVLFRAFNILKSHRPTARLDIRAHLSPQKRNELLALVDPQHHKDISFPGDGALAELPAAYAAAAVTTLTSRWEAFGLVIIESLASGTPVVATDDGAIPELLDDPRIGRLFDPGEGQVEPTNAESLAAALHEAIDLNLNPQTPDLCRAKAEQYAWTTVGPRFEALYNRLTNKQPEPTDACASH